MDKILYECYETGIINEKSYPYPAQFSTVKKYNILYEEELPRFRKNPVNFYALPFFDTPQKIYNGLGKMGLEDYDEPKENLSEEQIETLLLFEEDDLYSEKLMISESDAEFYRNLFSDGDDYELIWTRITGSNETPPDGYHLIGYDVTYPPYSNGAFSIICDCMFICKWHGCDENGTHFLDDFAKLNEDGLFDNKEDAYVYMVKYLNEDWSERGEYGIFEIYSKI